jgi:hypothetical protein
MLFEAITGAREGRFSQQQARDFFGKLDGKSGWCEGEGIKPNDPATEN